MANKEKQLLEIIFELRDNLDIAAGMTSAFSFKRTSIEEAQARYDALMEAYRMVEDACEEALKVIENGNR